MHETDTMQALCWKARALAVRHQRSSWKHRFNLHRGRELRIFGRFYVKKTGRVGSISRIRLAEIFLADFRRTKIRRRIRLTAQAWGSMVGELRFPVTHKQMAKFLFSIALCVVLNADVR